MRCKLNNSKINNNLSDQEIAIKNIEYHDEINPDEPCFPRSYIDSVTGKLKYVKTVDEWLEGYYIAYISSKSKDLDT